MIDGLKFVSAALIVLIHVADAAQTPYPTDLPPVATVNAGYWALFLFIMVSGYFHGSVGGRGFEWLNKRLLRLGVPYVFWSVVFLAYHQALQMLRGLPLLRPDPLTYVFLAGAEGVLWSLAMLFYCAVVVEFAVRTVRARRVAIVLMTCLAAAAHLALVDAAIQMPEYWALAPQWLLVYLIGMELRATPPSARNEPAFRWGFVASVLCLVLMTWVAQSIDARLSAVIVALLDVTAAWTLLAGATVGSESLGAARLAAGGDYLLGIYVSHYLFLQLWALPMQRDNGYGLPSVFWIAAGWVFCLGLSWLTTRAMMRIRWLRPAVV